MTADVTGLPVGFDGTLDDDQPGDIPRNAAGLPLVPTLPAEHQSPGATADMLHGELRALIVDAVRNHPRSLQTRIGPSEIGTPCTRRLAYKLGELPRTRPWEFPWRATIGTGMHAWVAEVLVADNARRAAAGLPARWVVEAKVAAGRIGALDDDTAGWWLTGHSDVYDRVTASVVDWKFVGPTHLKAARKGPKPTYRVQGHCYGYGWVQRGVPVRSITIAHLPTAGEFGEGVWWSEAYDEQVAVDALERANSIDAAGRALGYGAVGALSTVDDDCTFCEFFTGQDAPDPSVGRCPGAPLAKPSGRAPAAPADPLAGLIAR